MFVVLWSGTGEHSSDRHSTQPFHLYNLTLQTYNTPLDEATENFVRANKKLIKFQMSFAMPKVHFYCINLKLFLFIYLNNYHT